MQIVKNTTILYEPKKGANQFHSVLKVLDYLYTKNENQLTPMGIC